MMLIRKGEIISMSSHRFMKSKVWFTHTINRDDIQISMNENEPHRIFQVLECAQSISASLASLYLYWFHLFVFILFFFFFSLKHIVWFTATTVSESESRWNLNEQNSSTQRSWVNWNSVCHFGVIGVTVLASSHQFTLPLISHLWL